MVRTLGTHPARRLESSASREPHARFQVSTERSGQKEPMLGCLPVETTPRRKHTGIWDRSGAMPGRRCSSMRSRRRTMVRNARTHGRRFGVGAANKKRLVNHLTSWYYGCSVRESPGLRGGRAWRGLDASRTQVERNNSIPGEPAHLTSFWTFPIRGMLRCFGSRSCVQKDSIWPTV